jgi:hypothetical protein
MKPQEVPVQDTHLLRFGVVTWGNISRGFLAPQVEWDAVNTNQSPPLLWRNEMDQFAPTFPIQKMGNGIELKIYGQDGTLQSMPIADTRANRDFIVWCRRFDRHSTTMEKWKMAQVPATLDMTRQLISDVAMELGKQMVAYIEVQYPDVYATMNSGCKLSIRNGTHNNLMAALNCRTEEEYRAWIEKNKKFRREWLKTYRAIRKNHPYYGE